MWFKIRFLAENNLIIDFRSVFLLVLFGFIISNWVWVRTPLMARCTTLCDKVCQWLVTGQWCSLGTTVSSTNKTDCHDIAEILLKVALNTITLALYYLCVLCGHMCLFVVMLYAEWWVYGSALNLHGFPLKGLLTWSMVLHKVCILLCS